MVRCTIYAQISVPRGKDDVICMPPQWGSNSKGRKLSMHWVNITRFSPRNGEVILKETVSNGASKTRTFQSPQWGSNSKVLKLAPLYLKANRFQSPQWGSNSKVRRIFLSLLFGLFQSPQWGSNSKALKSSLCLLQKRFQSPQWGSNSKALQTISSPKKNSFQSPQWGSNSKGLHHDCWHENLTVSVPAMGK